MTRSSSPSPPESVPDPEAVGATLKILLVEDDPANVRLIERLVRRRPGIRLLTATRGSTGIELALEHSPDLVLLDLNLPDTSGEEVLRGIRRDPGLRGVPVVVMTGDAAAPRAERLLALGAREYISKPFDACELLHALERRYVGSAPGN